VLCVDLDELKEVNDVFGHATGDKLLIEVAHRVQAAARGAFVARLSGDEFGLIIDGKQPLAGIVLPNGSRRRSPGNSRSTANPSEPASPAVSRSFHTMARTLHHC
jgi:diguanylate cyclase (GGDEF)-like protein